MADLPKPLLRLPRALAYTTIRCTIFGALACSSSSQGETRADASTDALQAHDSRTETGSDAPTDGAPTDALQAYDSPTACEAGPIAFCGAGPCEGGACACPQTGAYYCSDLCPPGCEPFA